METLLVAIVAGFVGGLGAKLLEVRGNRLAHLRDRQLLAADEFASAAALVFIRLGAQMEALGAPADREAEWLAAFRAAVADMRQGVHDVTARLPRVELLFGRSTPPAASAVLAVESLHRISAELNKDETSIATVTSAFERGAEALGEFTDAARTALTAPVWKRGDASRPVAALPAPQSHGDDAPGA
jgi:hypothetical protein